MLLLKKTCGFSFKTFMKHLYLVHNTWALYKSIFYKATKLLQGLINLEPQYQLHISKLAITFAFFRIN